MYNGKTIERGDGEDSEQRGIGGRPPSKRVLYRDGRRPGRCRVIRHVRQEVNLHFVGRWFARAEESSMEYHAAQMLLLLRPWRSLRDLPGRHRSFRNALDEFLLTATPQQHQILANISYFYECSDRARQRREEEDGKEDGQRAPLTGVVLPMTAVEEPTEDDIRRARKERYAARERIYGSAAVEIAMRNRIFREEYGKAIPKPLARMATADDMAKYQEWGEKVLAPQRRLRRDGGPATFRQPRRRARNGSCDERSIRPAGPWRSG
uniref:Uncharacterized protein n=1 Tax=Mycena chlorophos TaxID=658473 RepID=A0ABQ0L3K2_MYCCL|nr:predicted protein [Mycena chlorophos]